MPARTRNIDRPFCLALMPSGVEFARAYEKGIKRACEAAGLRCGRVETQVFSEPILSRIYKQIEAADVIVADMTLRRPNVFYEVGYAHAMRKPTVLIARSVKRLPFDVKHYQHLEYGGSVVTLRNGLVERLLAALGGEDTSTTLDGQWTLAIFEHDGAPPSKVDSYTIRQLGRELRGSIQRVFGEGAGNRRYELAGYTDGGEIAYAFWPTSLRVHSRGCCNLKLVRDDEYEGLYYRPLASEKEPRHVRITLVKAQRTAELLGRHFKRLPAKLAAWLRSRGA
jgi:hypothetical protein